MHHPWIRDIFKCRNFSYYILRRLRWHVIQVNLLSRRLLLRRLFLLLNVLLQIHHFCTRWANDELCALVLALAVVLEVRLEIGVAGVV